MVEVALRSVEDSDLDALFDQRRDPESVQMAAFTAKDPNDRDAFDTHMAKVRTSHDTTLRAVTRDGHLVGSIGSFVMEGDTEITYWIDRSAWGQGIASQALALLLDTVEVQPLYARAASDIEPAREAIRRDAIDAVAALAQALVASDPQQTLDLLEIARSFDPHNELLYRDIMRLQERLGQLDAIPRTLTLLTTRLAELDETPTPQARALATRLGQRHDNRHYDPSTAPARSATTREPRRSAAS